MDYAVVQVACIRVKQCELLLRRPNDSRMAVPHKRHVVVNIEISTPGFVIKILHPSAHNLERAAIGDAQVFPQYLPSRFHGFNDSSFHFWKLVSRYPRSEEHTSELQ